VTSTVVSVLAPARASPLFFVPVALAGLLLMLWLLVKGVDVPKWQESAALADHRSA
jgi:threonine/homoserine/homoserine lactone efflux protein